MNSLRHPSEVHLEPLDPHRFREVLDSGADVLHDPWDDFAQTIKRGRKLFEGRTLWSINSTAAGGGVAEMLQSLMAYALGAGVNARWVAVPGTPDFFRVTKRLHNLLHGEAGDGLPLDQAARDAYRSVTQQNAEELAAFLGPRDVVILHDPQTAGMVHRLKETGAVVVWRSHIGTETPNDLVHTAWDFLMSHALAADARVFSRYAYVPANLRSLPIAVISPSIDPFSPKNQPLDPDAVHAILHFTGLIAGAPSTRPAFRDRRGAAVEVQRRCAVIREGGPPSFQTPLVVQVSRWDRLKDAVGVMQGFVEEVLDASDAHLVLAGPSVEGVADDPEGAESLAETEALWRSLPPAKRQRVHLACLPMDDLQENAAIVNALQRHAAVIVQKSLREGFGLTVTEAMWKARPIVASNLGGVSKQIRHGETGLLVDDPRDTRAFGRLVRQVLLDADQSQRLAQQALDQVRHRFLHSHHLTTWVTLLEHLISGGGSSYPRLDSSEIIS